MTAESSTNGSANTKVRTLKSSSTLWGDITLKQNCRVQLDNRLLRRSHLKFQNMCADHHHAT